MLKIRNKKIRTVLVSLLSMAMMFNSQSLDTYSAPVEYETASVVEVEEIEGVKIEPRTEYVTEVTPKEIVIEELPVIENEGTSLSLTDAEINLLAVITMAEAEGESEYGKRLVIDTILNRMDSDEFPDSVEGVIFQKNQFEPTWNGRMDRCYVQDDIRQLVVEELANRTNHDVVFFRGGKFSSYGTPMFQEGNHYFSKL